VCYRILWQLAKDQGERKNHKRLGIGLLRICGFLGFVRFMLWVLFWQISKNLPKLRKFLVMNKLDNLPMGLTFDDVLILPARGGVRRSDVSLTTFVAKGVTLDIPILSAAMDTVTESALAIALGKMGGLGVLHRNNGPQRQADMVKEVKEAGVHVSAAIGPEDIERASLLVEHGCDVLVVDTASAHNSRVIEGAKRMKEHFPNTPLIVGNIATAQAAKELITFADGIKVGVGPGSICTTRLVTGVGVPQLSAIEEVVGVAKTHGIPVIADGGIRYPGDIAKALGIGASSVMLGSMLAGTNEAPGERVEAEGIWYKQYQGMGSLAVISARKSSDRYFQRDTLRVIPEGIEAMVEVKGSLSDVVENLTGALRSSFGYVGAKNIEEFYEKTRFVRMSEAGWKESAPHSVSALPKRPETNRND